MDTIEIFKLFGSILVDNTEANKSISKTGKEADGLGKKLSSGAKTIGKWALGLTTAAAGVGTAMFAMTNKVVGDFDAIAKASSKLGVTTDAYQEMNYWAGQNGIAHGQFEKAVGRLNQRIGLAMDGNDKYASALDRLGVNLEEVKNGTLTTEDAMYQSIQALSQMENEHEKVALATELFGVKLARDLLPALQDGSLSLEDAKARAHELGLVIEEDTLRAAESFGDTWDDLTSSLGAFGQKILAQLMPVFQTMMEWVLEHMPTIQAVFSTAFDIVSQVVSTFIGWLQNLIGWFQTLFTSNQETFNGIWQTIQEVFNNVVTFLQEAWENIKSFWQENGQAILDNVMTIFNSIWETISTTFNFIWELIQEIFGLIQPYVEEVLSKIQEFWSENGEQIMKAVQNAFSFVQKVIEKVMPIVKNIVVNTWNIIKTAIDTVVGVIMGIIKTFASLLTGDFEGIKQGLTTIWESLWNGIKGVVEGAWNLLSGAFDTLWDSIGGWFTGIATDAIDWGTDLIKGFWEGIKSMGSWLGDKISDFISKFVPGPIKSVLGIASPSKLMMQYGEDTAEGLALGMESQDSRVGQVARNLAQTIASPMEVGTPQPNTNTTNDNRVINISVDAGNIKELQQVIELFTGLKQAYVTQ